jgi:hypothetical protein
MASEQQPASAPPAGTGRGAAVPLHERPPLAETELQMARRHVLEATDRLARQQALIATRLERFDDPKVIQLSIELMETLRMTVRVASNHLRLVEWLHPEDSANTAARK